LLNPQRPPSRWEPFLAKALLAIARFGYASLKQAIAGGQDAFPQGLFYTGREPIETQRLVAGHLDEWLGEAERVLHLDFHTGLGAWATHKLLVSYPMPEARLLELAQQFGEGTIEQNDPAGTAYRTTGDIGAWLVAQQSQRDYTYFCAEFGTYSNLKVLRGLRSENQAHHWCADDDPRREQAKQRLMELFCPASESWRRKVIGDSLGLIDRATSAGGR